MAILHPLDLGVILTYRCHSNCRHCLYNCGPGWQKEPMPVETLQAALETVAAWDPAPQVHLTGGEPFLHFPLLLEGARIGADLGLSCYVETNASWCTDGDEALERFSALRNAGLGAVLISCSPFHAERIPPLRTVTAAQAALEVFGPQHVIIYQPGYLEILQHFGLEHPIPLSSYEEEYGADAARRILWGGYGIISGGRSGYALDGVAPRRPVESFAGGSCAREVLHAHHSHFDLYGNYISGFCGGLTVGSWQQIGAVSAEFRAGRHPPLVETLVQGGPHALYEFAREKHGYRALPTGYAGKCHLCFDARRHLVTHGDYAELKPREFYDNF
ncbi:MAG: radical SAM protein [Anaerolineales bacterium]|nr:MAG: radical SAM protein [Anaerolineales bacterium]